MNFKMKKKSVDIYRHNNLVSLKFKHNERDKETTLYPKKNVCINDSLTIIPKWSNTLGKWEQLLLSNSNLIYKWFHDQKSRFNQCLLSINVSLFLSIYSPGLLSGPSSIRVGWVSKPMADSSPKGPQLRLGHLRVGELQFLSPLYSTRPCCLVQAITRHTCPDPNLDSWNGLPH